MYLPKVNRLFNITFNVNNNHIFPKRDFLNAKGYLHFVLTFTHQSLPKQSFGFRGGFENMKIQR